jgi:hypothetical protein
MNNNIDQAVGACTKGDWLLVVGCWLCEFRLFISLLQDSTYAYLTTQGYAEAAPVCADVCRPFRAAGRYLYLTQASRGAQPGLMYGALKGWTRRLLDPALMYGA